MYRRRRIEGKCKGGGWRDEETERTIKIGGGGEEGWKVRGG